MSVQFGKCNLDGKPVNPQELDCVRPLLTPYGPDGEEIFCKDNLGIVYRAFHTTKESRMESQPHVSPSGTVITWDGRLDNRSNLVRELGLPLSSNSTDLSIVTAAYEHWGMDSLAKLTGDWAISIWNSRSRSLILAKDFVGTRHLYYSIDNNQVMWSTILDPLVLFARKPFTVCEEYIAGWLAFLPAAYLTPYLGIDSVPPSSLVELRSGRRTIKKYWDFDPNRTIRYQTDGEYEEHFREDFAEAVRRRLRSDSPILAELSGGMDSSSIVCVADTIIARGTYEVPRLDTLSYYSDSEPNWNERPYFTKVEEKRGRTGCHIDVGAPNYFTFGFERDTFAATPGSGGGRPSEANERVVACMTSQGNRVVLSGIGGDEVVGGMPTPIPELMNLLATARIGELRRELKEWALNKRKPWVHLFFEAARGFFPVALVDVPKHMRPAEWLRPSFVKRYRAALTGYPSRVKLFGPLPSFQRNVSTVEVLRRQLACSTLSTSPLHEKRYPYLDRDLLEFVYALPPEQLVRPGQRRSLMRRALRGIVPDELLNRKRKAFVARGPLAAIFTEPACFVELTQNMVASSLEIVEAESCCEMLKRAHAGQKVPIVPLMRTLQLESWLRALKDRTYLSGRPQIVSRSSTAMLN